MRGGGMSGACRMAYNGATNNAPGHVVLIAQSNIQTPEANIVDG
jgi:hypothetical protein